MDKIERGKKLKLALPILIMVSAAVWLPVLKNGSKKETAKKISYNGGESVISNDILILTAPKNRDSKNLKSAFQNWGRNPFVTEGWAPEKIEESAEDGEDLEEEVVAKQQIVLNGIFFNDRKPSALINGGVVGVGTKIGTYEVIEITKDKVMINDGKEILEFRIQE